MTHRQYLVWRAWLDWQWHRPARLDYAIARVAMEACYSHPHRRMPNRVDLRKFMPEFEEVTDEPKPVSPQMISWMKAVWRDRMSVKGPPPPKPPERKG